MFTDTLSYPSGLVAVRYPWLLLAHFDSWHGSGSGMAAGHILVALGILWLLPWLWLRLWHPLAPAWHPLAWPRGMALALALAWLCHGRWHFSLSSPCYVMVASGMAAGRILTSANNLPSSGLTRRLRPALLAGGLLGQQRQRPKLPTGSS